MIQTEAVPSSLDIRLFGSLQVHIAGQPLPTLRTRKGQWLLALLTLRHDRPVERAWLAGTLWPESSEEQALYNLRQCLSNLRLALGPEGARLFSPTPHTLRLALTGVRADVVEFDRAISRGDGTSLQQAVKLYRGPLLEGCSEEWVLSERQMRELAYLNVLERLAEQAMQTGEPQTAAGYLRQAVAVDPVREGAQRGLLQALAASGDYAAAVLAYRELRRRLRRELNAEPDPQTTTLFEQIRAQARRQAVTPVVAITRSELPVNGIVLLPRPLTPLIGRQDQIEQILARLAVERLVTLTGAGGVGKTRLALAVSEALAEDYLHKAYFVDLAPLSDPSLVGQAVAQALGTREQPGLSLAECLLAYLQPKMLLLVLDNCEHLLAGCASLLQQLLQGCPQLKVLATSRQVLGLVGETVYRVPSLSTPQVQGLQAEGKDRVALLLEYEAPQLFVARASQAEPEFEVTLDNAVPIGQICRKVEGIPLAIELAAARVRALTLEQIAARLDDHLHLLTGGSCTALPRQQTLRATLDWSYELLTESERLLLQRLSMFAGGWTLQAAECICTSKDEGGRMKDEENKDDSCSMLHPSEVLDLLTGLIDKSLVMFERRVGEAEGRYRLLETIRQYGQERLAESEGEAVLRDRHLDYFLALAEEAEQHLIWPEPEQEEIWYKRLETEHDNLRAALDWSLKVGNREQGTGNREEERAEQSKIQNLKSKIALRLAGALLPLWWSGHESEGRGYLTAALAREGAAGCIPERAKALYASGHLAYFQGDYEASKTPSEQSLAIYRELGDKQGIAVSLDILGHVALSQGDYGAARALCEQYLAISRELENQRCIAWSLSLLGAVAREQDDYATARALVEQSLAIYREFGNQWAVGSGIMDLGHLLLEQGDSAGARACYEQGLALRREGEDTISIAWALLEVGHAAWLQQDDTGVNSAMREAMGLFAAVKEIQSQHGQLAGVESLAALAQSEGDAERAARLFGAAAGLRERLKLACHPWWRRPQRRLLEVAQDLPQTEEVGRAWEAGRAMTLQQAIDYALEEPGTV